ncbi:hypothetical protein LZ016_07620 [Sphingomonas sp. SM33]|uniref:Uncharacterized protein n=1 Tax=Sphingomonas telluris TaxID=2907998 RepID=A0ABS9VLW6_9SPHN|nr:hypothetical protein [Sphingomonas telluris]MCH8615966.1 hypothetical protein [Sphingomonas telluris]
MRTALCLAIGFAVVFGGVPASFAQDSRVVDHGKSAGTATAVKGRQQQTLGRGISLVVPTGKISVDPAAAAGEPIYVRRSTVRDGMTVVEVSTTPFMPVLASNAGPGGTPLKVRPDQPAGW